MPVPIQHALKSKVRPQPVVAAVPVVPAEPCCEPIIVAHFRREALFALYERHVGKRCAPKMESMNVQEWREANNLR